MTLSRCSSPSLVPFSFSSLPISFERFTSSTQSMLGVDPSMAIHRLWRESCEEPTLAKPWAAVAEPALGFFAGLHDRPADCRIATAGRTGWLAQQRSSGRNVVQGLAAFSRRSAIRLRVVTAGQDDERLPIAAHASAPSAQQKEWSKLPQR